MDFFVPFILLEGNFFNLAYYLDVECIEYIFRTHILSHIKNRYSIHFFWLILKPSKTFSVSFNVFFIFTLFLHAWTKAQETTENKMFLLFLNAIYVKKHLVIKEPF